MYKNFITPIFIGSMLLFSTDLFGQPDSLRNKLIESLSKDIYKYYVSAELARQMGDSIKSKYKAGGYDISLNMDEFVFEITKDLRRISGDNHITITAPHSKAFDPREKSPEFDALTSKELQKRIEKNKKIKAGYYKSLKEDMFAYGEIKILPGNIGYFELKNFESTSVIKGENRERITMNSVFEFLRGTSTIIIDLRENQGGATGLAAKFCSYFSSQPNAYFISEESFFRYDSSGIERELSFKKKYYTDAKIINSLTNQKSIYILISSRTFSVAELVAYKVKQFVPTATIIGQQTKGGGNGYSDVQFKKYYTATIPSSKSFDENNNNYNLEAKGITPDIFCSADSVLSIAYRLASNGNMDTTRQEVKYFKKTKLSEAKPGFEKYYPDYMGDYQKISVYINNGRLYMLYDTFKNCLLAPTVKDFFQTDGFEFVQFARNSNNYIVEILLKHKDGYLEKFRKL